MHYQRGDIPSLGMLGQAGCLSQQEQGVIYLKTNSYENAGSQRRGGLFMVPRMCEAHPCTDEPDGTSVAPILQAFSCFVAAS